MCMSCMFVSCMFKGYLCVTTSWIILDCLESSGVQIVNCVRWAEMKQVSSKNTFLIEICYFNPSFVMVNTIELTKNCCCLMLTTLF